MQDHKHAINVGATPIEEIEAVIQANIRALRRQGMTDAANAVEGIYLLMERRGDRVGGNLAEKSPRARTATN